MARVEGFGRQTRRGRGFPANCDRATIPDDAPNLPATADPFASRSGRRTRSSAPIATMRPVDLGRIAWICTVVACLITVAILLIDGYWGYAEVTAAVAVSAAINLT